MKKLIIVSLLLLITMLGFTGCGGNDEGGRPSPSPSPVPVFSETPTTTPSPQTPTTPTPQPLSPTGVDTTIRLGFVGNVPLEHRGLATSTLEGLVRDGWLESSAASVGYPLFDVEEGELRANAVVALLADFREHYRAENMQLVVLLSESANGGPTIGLFMHYNLRDNTHLAALFVQSLQDAFWDVDNVRHITRDDSYPRGLGILGIFPNLVTDNPQPPPPTFVSYTISPEGSLHTGDEVTITITASLLDRAVGGDILVYWYDEAGAFLSAGRDNSFTFTAESMGTYRFNVVLYAIVMQGDVPRRSRPTEAETIEINILAGIASPDVTPISIRIGDVVSARPTPTIWGQYLGVYTGTRQIELYTEATSPDSGTISIQWYARRVTDNMGYPPVDLSTYISTGNMRGFVPVSNRTGNNFSMDTIMSPTPPAFISTNIPGTFDYIARITNTNNRFPRQNTSYAWTDTIRITFRDVTPPPYEQFNVFFMAYDSDITVITEDIPARYYGDQDSRLVDFVAYINSLEEYRILYIHVEGRFNNVSNVQPPYANLLGVRLTRERAHIVRDRLIQLGITAPIYTRYNYRQDSAAYMQRRATVTVALQRI